MTDRTCSVNGCEKPTRTGSAELCNSHYFRWWRTGSTDPAPKRVRGEPKVCFVTGCDGHVRGKGMCPKHYARWVRHGHTGLKVREVLTGEQHPNWIGEDASYFTAHQRIARWMGPAAQFRCSICPRDAHHWAFTHACSDARESESGPYCLHPEHYVPLCARCHAKFDQHQARET